MRFFVIAALSALCLNGCATITRGSSQSWTVETDPVGADIVLSSGETCKSPCTLKKKRKHPFTVNINKEGYEPVKTDVQSSVSGAGAAGMAGNILVGGLIGLGVDAGTGANKDLKPNPLVVKLVASTATPAAMTAPVADAEVTAAVPVDGIAAATPSAEAGTTTDAPTPAAPPAVASDAAPTPAPAPVTEPATSSPAGGESPAAPQAAPGAEPKVEQTSGNT